MDLPVPNDVVVVDRMVVNKGRLVLFGRAENVTAHHEPCSSDSRESRETLNVGEKRYQSLDKVRTSKFIWMLKKSWTMPVSFGIVDSKMYWRFQDCWFWNNQSLNAERFAPSSSGRRSLGPRRGVERGPYGLDAHRGKSLSCERCQRDPGPGMRLGDDRQHLPAAVSTTADRSTNRVCSHSHRPQLTSARSNASVARVVEFPRGSGWGG